MRSNLWPGAAAVASGTAFTNVFVGWGIKTAPFLPLPPPPVAQEYDQVSLASCPTGHCAAQPHVLRLITMQGHTKACMARGMQ